MSKQEIAYWSCEEGDEGLTHTDRNAAIKWYLDGMARDGTETIRVYGYARMIVPEPDEGDAEGLLETFFNNNWEEFQGEDGVDITPEMQADARTFLEALHREFRPWACEIVSTETVNVNDWTKEHQPHWLKERG